MKKLTAAEIKELKASGARIKVKTPAKKTEVAIEPQVTPAAELSDVVAKMTASQSDTAEKLAAAVELLATKGAAAYRMSVNRDEDGLISSIDVTPMGVIH